MKCKLIFPILFSIFIISSVDASRDRLIDNDSAYYGTGGTPLSSINSSGMVVEELSDEDSFLGDTVIDVSEKPKGIRIIPTRQLQTKKRKKFQRDFSQKADAVILQTLIGYLNPKDIATLLQLNTGMRNKILALPAPKQFVEFMQIVRKSIKSTVSIKAKPTIKEISELLSLHQEEYLSTKRRNRIGVRGYVRRERLENCKFCMIISTSTILGLGALGGIGYGLVEFFKWMGDHAASTSYVPIT